jgi:hypothetical protein
MIRHIVFFKFREGVGEEKQARLINALESLKAKIPLVKELEVGRDVAGKPNSYDIALNSVFDNFDDVEGYAVHPDHVEVVKLVRELCESSVKVDFEF